MEFLPFAAIILLLALPAAAAAFWARRFGPLGALLLLAAAIAPAIAILMIASDESDRPFGVLISAIWLAIVASAWWAGRRDQTGRQRWARLLAIAAPIVAIAALCGGIYLYADLSEQWASRRAFRAERKALAERNEADARRCIAALARRSPEADAAADRARGDATPIGITHLPHDPAIFTTIYPNACPDVPSGHRYEPTGKWIGQLRSGEGDLFEPAAPSSAQCQSASRAYIERYNRHMVALAPGPVARFCRDLQPFRL